MCVYIYIPLWIQMLPEYGKPRLHPRNQPLLPKVLGSSWIHRVKYPKILLHPIKYPLNVQR